MANFNRVILMGNLTRDPELRYLPSNMAVCDFGMAVNRKWRDKEGNNKEDVCFVDIAAFGRQAEVIKQWMTKGRPMLVEGHLRFEQWTGQDGQKRSKLKVVVENFTFVGGREGGAGGGGGSGGASSGYGAPRPAPQPAPAPAPGGPPAYDAPPSYDAPQYDAPPPSDEGYQPEPPQGDRIPF